MLGMLIFKKSIKFGIRKKNLAKGKGSISLESFSFKRNLKEESTILTLSTDFRYIGCEC